MKDILSDLPAEPLSEQDEAKCGVIIQSGLAAGTERDAAIEKLVTHTMRDAYHYASRCAHGRLAEDTIFSLCYDALLRAARNFDPEKQRFLPYAKAYLRGLVSAKFVQADSLRKHFCCTGEVVSEGPLSTGDEGGITANEGPPVDPDWDNINSAELREKILPYLRRLSPQERLVLDLKYWGGFTFEDIGRLTRSSKSAAWGTHVRALRKLRKLMSARKRDFGLDT
jgi:RNA polymerase sigma factor (sigma-70 family)